MNLLPQLYPFFTEKNGSPLDDGKIYIGKPDLDPVKYPFAVYFDEEQNVQASQPIKTTNGFPVRNGAATRIYIPDNSVSIAVYNKARELIFYEKNLFLRNYFLTIFDFGAIGDGIKDDTPAFRRAANYGGLIIVPKPKKKYIIKGEVIFTSNTTLYVQSGTSFLMDCSGENARGFYFQEADNSHIIGDFEITAFASNIGANESKNTCIQFGNDRIISSPKKTFGCSISGTIFIKVIGANNLNPIYLSGNVENFYCEGVHVTGKVSSAITAHWTRNNFLDLDDETYHPTNLRFHNCNVSQYDTYEQPLIGFKFSGCGSVNVTNSCSGCKVTDYNLFVGDYGYTYAKNITEDQAFQFIFNDLIAFGETTIFADCLSDGFDGSPIWDGRDHPTSIHIDGLNIDANKSVNGAMIKYIGVNQITNNNVSMVSESTTHSNEFFHSELCDSVSVNGDFTHHKHFKIKTTKNFIFDKSTIKKPVPTPNVTSYSFTMENVDNSKILNSNIEGARTAISSVENHPKMIQCIGNTFKNIGNELLDIQKTRSIIFNNNTVENCGTSTTTTNLNGLFFQNDVDGACVCGNVFGANEYKYLVYFDNTCSNSTVSSNLFLDLNTSATNAAAVFRAASAVNIKVDSNTNITASGINLVYP